MPTNRDTTSSSRSATASRPGDNGSTTEAGNGAAYSPANQTVRPSGHQSSGNGENASYGLLGGIQQKVTSRVDEQKNRAADGLGGIADVIRNATNELRGENEALASYVDTASDQMRRFADQIRERGVAEMIDDVARFARRRPALFVGGAFLVGLAVARFMKSSADRGYDREYGSGFSSIDPMTAGTGTPSYSGDLGETGSY